MLPATLLTAILTLSASVLAAPAAEADPAPVAEADPAPGLVARGQYLGGLDLNTACQDQYDAWSAYAVQNGDGCGAWRCWNDKPDWLFTRLPLEMGDACVRRYGNPVYAWCEKGAWDWGCFRP